MKEKITIKLYIYTHTFFIIVKGKKIKWAQNWYVNDIWYVCTDNYDVKIFSRKGPHEIDMFYTESSFP